MLDSLRTQIQVGQLKPGDYLPSEVELGQAFQLSKESVRHALDELVKEGAILKIRRVGNRVSTPGEQAKQTKVANNRRSHPAAEAAAPTEVVTLKFAYYPTMETEAIVTELVSDFEREHPSIRVHMLPASHPHDYAEHGMADVFSLSAWDALKLKDRKSHSAVSCTLPEQSTNAYLTKPFLDAEGHPFAVPFVFSPIVLCYNLEHFRKCDLTVPDEGWTWYTLLKNARLLSRTLGVSGFHTHIQSINRWSVFLLQNGFRFSMDEVQRTSEDPALWESLRIARDLIQPQNGTQPLLTEHDADVERWFSEGRASMIMTTYYGMNRLLNTNIRYGVAPLPSLRTSDTLLLVTGLAVNRSTNHPEEAHLLTRYMNSYEAQSRIRRHTQTLPVHPEALALENDLHGNRPVGEPVFHSLWTRCKLYEDLQLGAGVLEAIREELKGYWSKLEDEVEASERLEHLFGLTPYNDN